MFFDAEFWIFQERRRSPGGRLAPQEQVQGGVQVSGQGVRADDDAPQSQEGVSRAGILVQFNEGFGHVCVICHSHILRSLSAKFCKQ